LSLKAQDRDDDETTCLIRNNSEYLSSISENFDRDINFGN